MKARTTWAIRPILWLGVLVCATTAWAQTAEDPSGEPRLLNYRCKKEETLPPLKVEVEWRGVDPSRYPEVDVYFRLIDTNPESEFHEPKPGEVKVQDGPAGEALKGATLAGDNFKNPLLRPLAVALCLDRSNSVTPVLAKINAAIKSYVGLMVRDGNTPAKPDETFLFALCGQANMASCRQLAFTPDQSVLTAFVDDHFRSTCLGSPIYQSWEAAIGSIEKHPFREPDEARAMVTITDGKQSGRKFQPEGVVRAAEGAGVQMFSIGPVLIAGGTDVVAKSVCRAVLVEVAKRTGGAYFEVRPPVPVMPDPPRPDEATNVNDPADLPDDEAVGYLQDVLVTANDLSRKASPPLDDGAALPAGIVALLTQHTALSPTPATWGAYRAALAAGPPAITNANQITLKQLEAVDLALAAFPAQVLPPIPPEILDTYYNKQVANVFKKIQASLKRVYRVTYTVDDPTFDGRDRQTGIQVDYPTGFGGGTTGLTGAAGGLYKAPQIIDENAPTRIAQRILPTVRSLRVVAAAVSPAGTPWTSELQLATTITLYGRVGQPPRPAKLAVKMPGQPARFLSKEEGGPDAPLSAEDQKELAPYLEAIRAEVQLELGQASWTVTAGMPTCIPDPDRPSASPMANDTNPEHPRLLWYSLASKVSRTYQKTITNAGNVTPRQQTVTMTASGALTPLVVYVRDRTPPTLAVLLSTEARGTSRLEAREHPPEQSPPALRFALSGRSFGGGGDLDGKLLVKPNDVEPLDLEGGAASPGYLVPQGVSVRLQLFARDNFDRNVEPEWPIPQPPDVARINLFDASALATEPARDGKPPFLGRLAADQIGKRRENSKLFHSGISWYFREAGSDTDAGAESHSFRSTNVKVDGDSITPISGEEIFLVVKASDASGNATEFKLPVRVTPVSLEIDKLFQERERK